MSIRVPRQAPKAVVALAGLVVASIALSGCASIGSRVIGDPNTTSAVPQSSPQSFTQPMPSTLGAPPQAMAAGQFLPPANIGGVAASQPTTQPLWNQQPVAAAAAPAVQSQDLPVLSPQSPGSLPAMPQPAFASAAPMPSPAVLGSLPNNNSVPTMAAMPTSATVTPLPTNGGAGTFTHMIASGESLYTIARRYEVTTQSIVQANNLSSPDKIVVGQRVIIPGRPDLLATKAPVTQVATAAPGTTPVPVQQTLPTTAPNALQAAAQAPAAQPAAAPVAAPTQVASAPAAEPVMSGNDKFRWPVSGRVLVDFASSKGTGINIEAAEGAPIKAAENGTVIYVGSGVEGYGNLVLIRHPNGFVSAYAHLSAMSVAKGANVNRGDTIGAVGQTGSVTKPQLHFELRKGATPIDPVPLLAG